MKEEISISEFCKIQRFILKENLPDDLAKECPRVYSAYCRMLDLFKDSYIKKHGDTDNLYAFWMRKLSAF